MVQDTHSILKTLREVLLPVTNGIFHKAWIGTVHHSTRGQRATPLAVAPTLGSRGALQQIAHVTGEIHDVIQVELAAISESMGRVSRVTTCDGDTDRRLSRPLMVLQAYPHGSSHEPETRIALVNHSVSVTETISTNVTIHNWVWGTAVASQTSSFGATPEPICQALSDMRSHKCVASVARKYSRGPINCQRSNLVAIWGKGKTSTRDNSTAWPLVSYVPRPIGLALHEPPAL